MPIKVSSDGALTIAADNGPTDPKLRKYAKRAYNEVACWWAQRSEDTFYIRQENKGRVDMLELSQGQCYDLLVTLNVVLGLQPRDTLGKV